MATAFQSNAFQNNAFQIDVSVVTTPSPGTAGGAGGLAWRSWYKSKLPKKKRKLVDELDEMIAELRARIVEAPSEVETTDHELTLRVSEALAQSEELGKISNVRLAQQIAKMQRAIEEIDDEEAVMLLLH